MISQRLCARMWAGDASREGAEVLRTADAQDGTDWAGREDEIM